MSIRLDSSMLIYRKMYNSGVNLTGSSKKGKKDISDAVNEETIEKVKQLAAQDAIKGSNSYESILYLHQCREKVAPNRNKIFNNAEGKLSQVSKGHNIKLDVKMNSIWEYLLKYDDKSEHLLKFDDKIEDSSFKGTYCTANNHSYIEAYDEKGERIGTYDSKSGWKVRFTSLEKQAYGTLANIYNETFREVYKSTHGKNGNTASIQSESRFDITA